MNKQIFRCDVLGHMEQPISKICLYKFCKSKSAICNQCSIQNHRDHLDDLKNVEEFKNHINETLNINNIASSLKRLKENTLQLLTKLIQVFDKYFQNISQFHETPNLETLNRLGIFARQKEDAPLNEQIDKITDQIQMNFCKYLENYQQKLQENDKLYRDQLSPSLLVKQNQTFEFWLLQGDEFIRQNQIQQAIQSYENALLLPAKPDKMGECYSKLGVAFHDIQKYSEAINYYEKAISIQPKLDRFYNKGLALEKLGYSKKALDAYISARNMSPNDEIVLEKINILQNSWF